MQNVNILYILTTDLLLQNVTVINVKPVLSSERAPHMDRKVTGKQEIISGHEPHDKLTDRPSQGVFDLSLVTSNYETVAGQQVREHGS
jgi:hypothetical protein